MKNSLFKAQVAELFEKAGNSDVRRGHEIIEGVKDIGSAAKGVLGAGYHGLSHAVSPESGGLLARGIEGAGKFVMANPKLALGTAAMAPILGNAFLSSQAHHQRELMDAYAQPERAITASLDDFLEKKAELYSMSKEAAAAPSKKPFIPPALKKMMDDERRRTSKSVSSSVVRKMNKTKDEGFWPSTGQSVVEGLGKGLGSAFGGTVVGLLAHGIGTGVDALRDHFMLDPKRKALVDTLVRTDPVLSDAVDRHPDSKTLIRESYGTMERFAPTLSLDINAVRSFLREAVLGGSGVNYATIKNLVDTEKSIAEAKPRYGGGGH